MRGAYSAVATLIALLMETVAFATLQEKSPEEKQTQNPEAYGPPAPFVRKLSSSSDKPVVWPPAPASVLVAPVATTAPTAGLPNAAVLENAPALPPRRKLMGPLCWKSA